MPAKKQILDQSTNPQSELAQALNEVYADTSLIAAKLKRITSILENPALDADLETVICRCPGRISCSKHADYINSDLLYTLDDRDIYIGGQIILDSKHPLYGKFTLINCSKNFEDTTLGFAEDELDQQAWCFYPYKIWQELQNYEPKYKDYGLVLVYDSDLPAAGGLSSSHALMISTLIALAELLEIDKINQTLKDRNNPTNKNTIIDLLHLLQRVEHGRGFNSGLGDQSAELLSQKNKLSFIKIKPDLDLSYQNIDTELVFVTAPSLIKADKSLPEFQAANENIKIYKEINFMAANYGCDYLADLIYKYPETKIFEILETIQDRRTRGLALYGLAEATRIKNLKKNFSSIKLGEHLNLSHQAEKNFKFINDSWQAIPDQKKLNYEFDKSKTLAEHSGIYLASTLANDQLQALATSVPGVYGSSISGAGLGGNNIIACNKNSAHKLIEALDQQFYALRPEAKSKHAHLSSSSAAAARVF